MAKHDAEWHPDTDDGPVTQPMTRDQLVQENRERRVDEPAAAPQETDSESGSAAAVPLSARTEPVRTHAVNAADNNERDVRAGPGDAGAADTPTRSPERVPDSRDNWRKALVVVAVIAVVWIVLGLVF